MRGRPESGGSATRGPARLAALCAALALLGLGGCNTTGSGPTPSSGGTDAAPSLGPLELYLGDAVGGARTQGEVAAELAAREDAVAACMAEQGFEYVPEVMVQGSFAASDEPARGTRAFAERYGYGVWRGPEVEPGQFTYQLDGSANAAYRASLSSEAQQAYDEALLGRRTDRGDGVVDFDGTGCR